MRNVLLISCSVSMAMLLFHSSILCAHGVKGKIGKGGIVVIAEYSTGEPMSYAKVNIFAPSAKLPFQSGRTDRNGRFCFFPDAPGQWRVVVSDEMGHRLQLAVPVTQAMKIQSAVQQQDGLLTGMSVLQRLLLGLSLIFGAMGIIVWWRSRKGEDNMLPSKTT